MMDKTNYLQYAKKYNRKINSYQGVVIYDPEFGSLPQDVLFLPGNWDKKGNLKDFMIKNLRYKNLTLYQVYFQAIRWIIPDVEERLNASKFININIGQPLRCVKATYAELTFDSTPNMDNDIPEIIVSSNFPIAINEENFSIQLTDIPDSYGILKMYQSINW